MQARRGELRLTCESCVVRDVYGAPDRQMEINPMSPGCPENNAYPLVGPGFSLDSQAGGHNP
jgi:hypothetical protein